MPFAGLLTSGIVPAMRHCLQSILTDDTIMIPASATVFVQVAISPINILCVGCCASPNYGCVSTAVLGQETIVESGAT